MTTTTLRPDGASALFTTTLSTAVGAATLWQCVSDNSDSSYADEAPGAHAVAVFTVTLGTVAMPAGAVTKSLLVRARTATTTNGTPATINCNVYDQIGTGYASCDASTSTTTIATFSGAATALTLTQAQVDGLVLGIGLIDGSHGGFAGRVYEMYLDLTYALVPVVTPSAPTGVQATPTPTCTWAYTAGSDGGVQSRYQVRVFTAAQYGIGGFDPAVSPATYDSGVVLGAATSQNTSALANSSTWRAYVNVAQTINGTPQWSGYSFSAFTTSFVTSDITSIVGTADNVNGRITLLITRNGATATWTNLDVQRSDDGGTTWNFIRGGNSVAVSGSTWPLKDYESGNNATVTYRARAGYTLSSVYIVGAWVNSSTVSWTMPADWLKDCYNTVRNRTLAIKSHPVINRARPQGVYTVIGRADPIVLSDGRSTRSGSLEMYTYTDTQANDLLALTATDVLLLQTRPGNRFSSAYIAISGVTETALFPEISNEPTRIIAFSWVEVLKPIDVGII